MIADIVSTTLERESMADPEGNQCDIVAPIRTLLVRCFALIAGVFVALLMLTAPLRNEPAGVVLSYIGLLVVFAGAYSVRNRRPAVAGALCSLGPLLLVSILVWMRGGIVHPAGVTAYVTLVAITGLCWSSRGAFIVALMSSAILAWFIARAPDWLPYNKLQVWAELNIELAIICMLVHFTLRALTASARGALSHQARFRDAIEASPDAIIALDGRGVVQILRRLSRQHPDLKVLLISGYTEGSAVQSTVWTEGIEFLSKPFMRSELAERIESLLVDSPPDDDRHADIGDDRLR